MGQFSWDSVVLAKDVKGKGSWRNLRFQSVSGGDVKARLQIDVEERCFPFQSNQRESGISSRGTDFPVSGRAVIEAEERRGPFRSSETIS